MVAQRPLTSEEKIAIYEAIRANMTPDDRYPCEVIHDYPYNGDEERYLRDMAGWHKVLISD
ncbi:MAG: hypothetical protein HYV65_02210 [Candidatus Spechtbacteria bacterium]|nr:hypothetical protein [Candidatus Spechtbacteria bacterium]